MSARKWFVSGAVLLAFACVPVAAAPERTLVIDGAIQVEVSAIGQGPLIVMLPSAARGAADLEEVAQLVAAAGFRVLCLEPRGSGRTAGPHLGVMLEDVAGDVAAVIRAERAGAAIVVGHAAGSFVARMLAVSHPSLVRGVVLAAAGARNFRPELGEAVQKVHDEHLSAAERMVFLRRAFFAPASDPSVWLTGWRPLIQFGKGGPPDAASKDRWWGAGTKPVLEIQGADDPFKPASSAGEFKAEFGERVTVVMVRDASHALFPEQPRAVAATIIGWAKALPQAGPHKN